MYLADIDLRGAIFVLLFVLWPLLARLLGWLASKAPKPPEGTRDPRLPRRSQPTGDATPRDVERELRTILFDEEEPLAPEPRDLPLPVEPERVASRDQVAGTVATLASAEAGSRQFEPLRSAPSEELSSLRARDLATLASGMHGRGVPSRLGGDRTAGWGEFESLAGTAALEPEVDEPARALRLDSVSLREAIVWREILGPPVALSQRTL